MENWDQSRGCEALATSLLFFQADSYGKDVGESINTYLIPIVPVFTDDFVAA